MAKRRYPIDAGKRDRLVTVQGLTDTVGDSGFPVETWAELTTWWVHKESVDAPERFTEGVVMDQISARSWDKWTGDYRAELDPDLIDVPKRRRVVYEGRTYDVVAAKHIGRREGIEFLTLGKVG